MEDKLSLRDAFHQYFEFVPATTKALREQAYKIRYEVYCEELAYENPEAFPDQLEQDCFDKNSLHYLLKHKESQEFAACVRLAMVDSNKTLPFESTCGNSLYIDTDRPVSLEENSCFEISRLAVRSQFRQRRGEQGKPYSIDSAESNSDTRRTNYPLITYGLYMACFAGSGHHQLSNVFVMMENSLARRLRIMGVLFEQIGFPVEHRGLRAPYRILASKSQAQMSDDLQQLISDMRSILESVEPSMKYEDILVHG